MRYFNFHAHLGATTLGEAHAADELVADMKALGVERVGISNLNLPTTTEKNDLILEAKSAYPDFIRAYCYVSFKDPNMIEEIDRRMEQGFDGFKIIPQWEGVRPDHHPAIEPVMNHLRQFGKIVQIATGTASTPYPWIEYARQWPELNVCLTHIGCREMGHSIITAIRDVPNIVVETSQNYDYFQLKRAIDELGSERVCMGTDWPYKPQYVEVHKFEDLGLSQEQLENIYFRNAARLWEETL